MRLSFLGATGTVTGSRYLVEAGGRRVLVDCGLFQGYKQLRQRNWSPLPVSARAIDAVVLTHAHLDHSGYLPRLVRDGFPGPVYCTSATEDLCRILLPDSGHLQEADAQYAQRRGFSRHHPPQPLYTEADARRSLTHFRPVELADVLPLPGGMRAHFHRAGHILGACSVVIEHAGQRIAFSGDVGRPDDPLMRPPAPRPASDWLVCESTYGDRLHPTVDAQTVVGEAIRRTIARGGTVVIPSFAVGRTQLVLLLLSRLARAGELPPVPIVVDSPMATSVTHLYAKHTAWHRLDGAACRHAFDTATYTQTVDDSKALDMGDQPRIIISASGMATGGRVVHHLRRFVPIPENLILFVGFQAGGTRGASLVAGKPELKIHGGWVPVRAEILSVDAMSAHADADELIAWLRSGPGAPLQTFVTHGEPGPSDAFRQRIEEELQWSARVPEHLETVEL